MSTLKVLRNEPTGVLFADPAKPDFTVRFKTTEAKKGLNGISVANYVEEIIVNDNNAISIGGVSASDAISVRIRTSATANSSVRVEEILLALAAQLPTWIEQGVLTGFRPETAPIIPKLP